MTQEKLTIQTIRDQIIQLPKKEMDEAEYAFIQRYLGTKRKVLGIKTADLVKIAKPIAKSADNSDNIHKLIGLLNNLFKSDILEEYLVGGKIFVFLKPDIRKQIPYKNIKHWLSGGSGWLEVDVICQNSLTGAEVLEKWESYKKAIEDFSHDKDIQIRRASIVLLVKPVGESENQKLRDLAYSIINKLKHEKNVLITKAISWLLRSLTIKNKLEVKKYIEQNKETLPKIAIRETLRVIETGKKNIHNKNKEQNVKNKFS